MERQRQFIQPLVYCAVVFITLGIAIANEILARFGLENNYLFAFSIAFVVAGLLLSKNVIFSSHRATRRFCHQPARCNAVAVPFRSRCASGAGVCDSPGTVRVSAYSALTQPPSWQVHRLLCRIWILAIGC